MSAAETRAEKQTQSIAVTSITRMTGLRNAASMMGGQDRLAEILGIEPRSFRSKLTADRGIYDHECLLAAAALDVRAAELVSLAARLRAEVRSQTTASTSSTPSTGTSS